MQDMAEDGTKDDPTRESEEDRLHESLFPGDDADQDGNPDPDADGDQEGDEGEDSDEETALEDLPQSWQDEIKRLRNESGTRRSKIRSLQAELRDARAGKQQTPEAELEAAVQRGRDEAKGEFGTRLAGAEVKAALKGVLPEEQITTVVSRLNLASYVDDEGEVDAEEVASLREFYVSIAGRRSTPSRTGAGKGTAGRGKPQKSHADLLSEALSI